MTEEEKDRTDKQIGAYMDFKYYFERGDYDRFSVIITNEQDPDINQEARVYDPRIQERIKGILMQHLDELIDMTNLTD